MGKRTVLKALLMGIIPFVHAYLFYCWCNEAKVKWKVRWLNSTLYAVLFLFPLLQVYPLYKFFSIVDGNLRSEGKRGYSLKPLPFALLFLLLPLAPLLWIYAVYSTQLLFNENGVETLG